MKMLEIALLIVLSVIIGAAIMRLFDLRELKAKQKVLNHCVITLNRAIKLNDQMLYMLEGKAHDDAALAAELDEIWRLNP
jgi:hypothetical protein